MSDQLSQLERSAFDAVCERESIGLTLARPVWAAARDYGRERERALWEVLAFYAERTNWFNPRPGMAAKPPAERDEGAQARAALAASQPEVLSERSDTEPREPEGQCSWCDGKRGLMEPDGSKLQPCPHCQPDHGPGEPSDALKRLKSWRDILERETALESRENDEQVEVEGRVLHNLKQAIDAVLVGESNG